MAALAPTDRGQMPRHSRGQLVCRVRQRTPPELDFRWMRWLLNRPDGHRLRNCHEPRHLETPNIPYFRFLGKTHPYRYHGRGLKTKRCGILTIELIRKYIVWYPHPELNGNQRFRKPLLYPFELWGLTAICAACKNDYIPSIGNGHSQKFSGGGT
jgi:hypothetical protein